MIKKVLWIGLFSAFLVVAISLLISDIRSLLLAKGTESWLETPGIVVTSEMGRHHDSDFGTTYSADIKYEYTINGILYSGGRVYFGEGSSSDPSHARKILRKYPAKKEVIVHYDQTNPDKSVLEPGIRLARFLVHILLNLILILTVLLLVAFGFFADPDEITIGDSS